MFPSKTGQPLRHNLFYRRHFRPGGRGLREAGRDKVAGALPAAKQHSSVEMTLNRHSHLMPNVAEALADKPDAIYRAAPQPAQNVSELHR